MVKAADRKIVLEDGRAFYGYGFGARREAIHELVFNTSMVGYQEIVSDPAHADQMIAMTYPLIGNYGITDEDFEARAPMAGGLIVREYNDFPSNFRYTRTLSEILEESGIPGISCVDTRMLARIIRDGGSRKALITAPDTPECEARRMLAGWTRPTDAVRRVSCRKRWYARTANPRCHVVALDCGIKLSQVRKFNERGVNVTVVPHDIPAADILSMRPDGLFISSGPGDPMDAPEVVALVRALRGNLPIFGVGLGHQLIALAYGAKTFQLKSGHYGGNHPVRDLATGKVEITSQGHGYAVDADSLRGCPLAITHVNLLDQTVEGLAAAGDSVFSVQYQPESAPGPQDSGHLLDRFIASMAQFGGR